MFHRLEARKADEARSSAPCRTRARARRPGVAAVVITGAVGAALVVAAAGAALASRPGPDQLEMVATRPQFISPYPPLRLAAGLGVVLGAVWLTYGYVLYQVWRMARQRDSG